MNRTAARRWRRLSPLPPPRLLAVAIAFASTLLFLVLVLRSTSPSSLPHHSISGRRTTSGSSTALPHHCGAASLGELGDAMVLMLPKVLPFTVFVPSRDSFSRVLGLQGSNASTGAEARPTQVNRAAARRWRRLSPLLPPRLLALVVAFASTLLFLVLVLCSTFPPSLPHCNVSGRRTTSGSSTAQPHRCGAASLGELGDAMVSMLPKDLPFTVFVLSRDSFGRVLGLQRSNASAGAEDDDSTYTSVGASTPARRARAAAPPTGLRVRAADPRLPGPARGARHQCPTL
ncbi:hypothetical protein BAE44_0007318 [Dichanthelium oligosanthes]|uniref:Uncharacterized protein n=1 Tax=Dichanthelium oligosanthes TaxID=888268 RepID=A0A1E5W2Y2_9POAL|nr:hypothetical protein BAE44_0007318 [Dichanthelium oligosanthes]